MGGAEVGQHHLDVEGEDESLPEAPHLDLGRDRREVGLLSFRPLERGPDGRGMRPHVGILEEEPIAGRGLGAVPARPVLSDPARRERRRIHPTDLGRASIDHARGPVGRAVLHDEDLQVRIVLSEQAIQGRRQVEFLVARRDHDTDPRSGLLRGSGRRRVQPRHLSREQERKSLIQEDDDRRSEEEELDPERDHRPA